jgi:lon-related putative ATP-dependent protease
MKKNKPLAYRLLRQSLRHQELSFQTTNELEPLDQFLGQKRALEAVQFGIGIKSDGYNLYAMGPSGIGKYSLVHAVLTAVAAKQPKPSDWCYIYNFEKPEQPIALQLPAGIGIVLQKDMKSLVQELNTMLITAFESDEYHTQLQAILDQFNAARETVCKKNKDDSRNITIPRLYKERHQKEREIKFKFARAAIAPLIKILQDKYEKYPSVVAHLTAVENDIVFNIQDILKIDENSVLLFDTESTILIRYQINLLVNNENAEGAPVIYEENPSYSNLICRVEHAMEYGAQVTNFMLIKPGALHKANGGYLLIEARKIKKEKHAWEGLKRALYAKNIMIEPVEHFIESARPVSLQPVPIPLEIKVILLGNRNNYYALSNDDPDFSELFKVAVDFDEEIERNKTNITLYARLIATIVKREGLHPFHASAVAAIIDYSTRLAEDKRKLSTHIRSIDDLIIESDYWASAANEKIVTNRHVKQAIDAKIHRLDRARQLYYEEIYRDFILIHTNKQIVGQINCLSVVKVGKFSYGHPTRITARVRAGKGKLLDIQREVDLAGAIHSKGGLILSNFLASRYHVDFVFSLAASISFEQIYGRMDGDSASVAELCALLSALSDVPIKQSLAVTGALDQSGMALAIGAVNEKIEGFFDICQLRGLNGTHGVIIPAVNITNLMLREDIIEAARKKLFFIYSVKDIDEAIFLLTGLPAGKRNKKGKFTSESINYLVEKKLQLFAEMRKRQKIQK